MCLGFHYNDKLFDENAFSEQDLFNKTISEYFIPCEVEVTAIKTLSHGVCFTFTFPNEVELTGASGIAVKRNWDLVIYFHNEGEQFWLTWYNFPILMTSQQFNINTT